MCCKISLSPHRFFTQSAVDSFNGSLQSGSVNCQAVLSQSIEVDESFRAILAFLSFWKVQVLWLGCVKAACVVAQNILSDEHLVTIVAREDQVCCDDLFIDSIEVAAVGHMNVVEQTHEPLVVGIAELALKFVLGRVKGFNFQIVVLLHFMLS